MKNSLYKKTTSLLSLFAIISLLIIVSGCGNSKAASKELTKVRLDYAYYSPTSLILKKFGWAEEEFGKDGVQVEWTLSQGSNKALEFLTSNSIDFGSAAGAATLITKSKGVPIKNVYVLSQPEWTGLLSIDSSIQSVEDLVGKKVAATYGTDPFIFLLRALDEKGISSNQVDIINLQHNDGYQALLKGDVIAWAGLDPIMATAELESNANIFFRNVDFNTYSFLNVREEFANDHPEEVKKVIELYEKAREWIVANPEEAASIIAEQANINIDIAKKQLERNNFSQPIPGDAQKNALLPAGDILQSADIIASDVKIEELVDELINPSFAKEVIK